MCGEAKAAVAIVGLALPNRTLRGQVVVSLPSLAALRVLNLSGNAIRGTLPAGLLRLRTTGPSRCSTLAPTCSPAGWPDRQSPVTAVIDLLGLLVLRVFNFSSSAVRILRLSMNRLSGVFPLGFEQLRSLAELFLNPVPVGRRRRKHEQQQLTRRRRLRRAIFPTNHWPRHEL